MDYELQRCTRHCAASGRELAEGETYFSVVMAEGAELKRYDYSASAWTGPPEGSLGWWKSQMPDRHATRPKLAPSEAMLEFFAHLADNPDQQDLRFVLALLLLRRRIVRLEETRTESDGTEVMVLYCPRDESTHLVRSVEPGLERSAEIEAELHQLLFAGVS